MNLKHFFKGLIILNIPVVILVVVLFFFVWLEQSVSLFMLILYPIAILLLFNAFYVVVLSSLRQWLLTLKKQLQFIAEVNTSSESQLKNNFLFNDFLIKESMNNIHDSLSKIFNNVRQIANEDLDTTLVQLSQDDKIGKELSNLQTKLKSNKAELEKTKQSEEKRNWITAGLTKFGDVLRQDSKNIEEMGYSIISNLIDYVELNQGALYILADSEDGKEYFESIATVAYDRQKTLEKRIMLGEGLVGQCAYEGKRIYMTHLPDDYINIKSGLGAANPTNLLIVPCLIEDKVFGIIEVASFSEIAEHQIEFIERLGESIASSVSNFQNAERTNTLLEASKNQSDELAAHQEELKQNLEEMETTQDDLRRQMDLNAEMQKELKFEKYLFDILLTNIPARINFKDAKRKYIRASKSFLERFGKESNDEIVGKTDVDFFGLDFAAKTMADELEIMQSKQPRINFIEHEVKDNGEEIWKNVSKIPLFDDDGKCLGIFASVYDITDSKIVEKKLAAEKLLFDTLLNNIPARINFKDADRKYIRASKSFLERFGKKSNDEIVGKTDADFFGAEFAKQTMADELDIIKTRKGRINFIEHELKDNGEQIWKNVSKIPLIDEEDNVLGIFASVYDITDYKLAELENQTLKKEMSKLKKK